MRGIIDRENENKTEAKENICGVMEKIGINLSREEDIKKNKEL